MVSQCLDTHARELRDSRGMRMDREGVFSDFLLGSKVVAPEQIVVTTHLTFYRQNMIFYGTSQLCTF